MSNEALIQAIHDRLYWQAPGYYWGMREHWDRLDSMDEAGLSNSISEECEWE